MPRIVLDARKYADFGIGTYIRGLLSGFLASFPERDFHLLTLPDQPLPSSVPKTWTVQPVAYRRYGLGEIVLMGGVVRRSGSAIFHSPHYTVPLFPGLPTVVTIHDLIHLRFPAFFSIAQRTYARLMIQHAISEAATVVTPSESTRLDLLERFDVPEEKIRVTPLGVGREFRPIDPDAAEEFRKASALPRRFALFMGNPKPHKGLSILLQSIRIILRKNKDLPLIIAGITEGSRAGLESEIQTLGLAGRVHLMPFVPSESMPKLINCATIVTMPSLWEGFGLPVIEAMACGTPVVCSTAGSLPEVAGDAALQVPPGDAEALAEALLELAEHENVRQSLRKKGLERAAQFTWEATARATQAIYEGVLS